ncbi:MAG TPA: hypothetical protein VGB74_16465 [Actinoplanes sp.]|jgi:hypothetical protein
MRRALLAVIAGGTLLAGTACDSDANDATSAAAAAPSTATPTTSPAPDYSASTRQVCGKLQTIYQGELRDLGTALGKMITYKEAKQATEAKKAENTAAGELKAVATKIRKETAGAADPDFQRAGLTSAGKLELSAADRRYFARVKTLKDLNGTIQGQLTEWLNPVAGYCG